MLGKIRRAYIALGRVLLCAWVLLTAPDYAQTGLVGWWKLDEGSGSTTADASTYGNNGTLVNSPVWASGRVGPGALTFNTSTSYVNIPNTSGSLDNLQNTTMTVSAWIKPTGTGGGGGGRIIEKGGWFFAMQTVGSSPVVRFTIQDTGGYRSSAAITLNTWTHVAATWDGIGPGSGIHLFINGVQADGTANAGTGTPTADVGSASVGNRASDLARAFAGTIDDVRVYNRTLSASEIAALADSTAPGAPGGLTATAASSSQVNLSWTASTDNVGVTGYLIERCQGSGCSSFAQIATVTGTSYNDTGRTASTSYSYRIRATDANSNLSSYSNTASATTPASGGDISAPSAPTGLGATATSSSQINLTWTASTDNVGVTGYNVERCSGATCTTFAQMGTPTTTSYSDTGLTASTTYRYQVRAHDAAGNLSSYSSIASATTPGGDTQAPTAPTGLVVLASSSTEVDLTWGASTDNVAVTGYFVERCSGSGCSNFTQPGTPGTAPYYDTPLTPATAYSYRVQATDAAGNRSAYSNVITITTPVSSPDCN